MQSPADPGSMQTGSKGRGSLARRASAVKARAGGPRADAPRNRPAATAAERLPFGRSHATLATTNARARTGPPSPKAEKAAGTRASATVRTAPSAATVGATVGASPRTRNAWKATISRPTAAWWASRTAFAGPRPERRDTSAARAGRAGVWAPKGRRETRGSYVSGRPSRQTSSRAPREWKLISAPGHKGQQKKASRGSAAAASTSTVGPRGGRRSRGRPARPRRGDLPRPPADPGPGGAHPGRDRGQPHLGDRHRLRLVHGVPRPRPREPAPRHGARGGHLDRRPGRGDHRGP